MNRPDTVLDLEHEFNRQRRSMARNLLNADKTLLTLDDHTRATMELVLAEKIASRDKVKILDVANYAEIAPMYVPFAELSNSSVHASLRSLNRHLAVKDDGSIDYFTVLVTDPKWDNIFHLGCCIVFFTRNFFGTRFSSPGRSWVDRLWKRFEGIDTSRTTETQENPQNPNAPLRDAVAKSS